MKKFSVIAVLAVGLFGLLRGAGDATFWRQYVAAVADRGAAEAAKAVTPRIVLRGAGGALPRSPAEAESVSAEGLAVADEQAKNEGARALIVHRHGHRIHEYFAPGFNGAMEVAGGELSPALSALATGALVDNRRMSFADGVQSIRTAMQLSAIEGWRNPWSRAARQKFSLAAAPAFLLKDADGSLANTISQRVWQPLGASDAWLWGRDDTALRVDCCVVAHLDDWTRVGDLFLQQGSYAGERIVSTDWIRHLLAADAQGQRHPVWITRQQAWAGAEPPAAREVYWFDLGPDLRLWLVPRRALSVLHWASGSQRARDTAIPNIIIRGLTDSSPAVSGAAELNDIVPGH
jgi:hypothetical protein